MSVVSEGKLHSVIPSGGSGDWTVERNSTATYVDKDGLIKIAPPNTPRIDWSTGEPMLLVEGESRNLIRNSNLKDISKWDLTYVDGNVNIWRDEGDYNIIECIANDNRPILQEINIQVEAGKEYTASVWVHSLEGSNRSVIAVYGGHINFSQGNVPNGVEFPYRLEMTVIPFSSGSVSFRIGLGTSNSTTGRALLSRPQIEEGSKATSYIPTNGSTVTRLADNIYKNNAQDLIGQSEGTVYITYNKTNPYSVDSTMRIFGMCSSENPSGRIILLATPQPNNIRFIIDNNDRVNQVDVTYSAPIGIQKIAFTYSLNGYALFFNGAKIAGEEKPVQLLENIDQLILGSSESISSGTHNISNPIESARLYKTALSYEQLIALTTL